MTTAEKISLLLTSCYDEAAKQGFEGSKAEYEFTADDLSWIAGEFGRKPTKQEWQEGAELAGWRMSWIGESHCAKYSSEELTAALRSEHGGLVYDDTLLALEQQAYCDSDPRDTSRTVYRAAAQDKDGNRYRVLWALKPEIEALEPEQRPEDASEMCDWDKPEAVELIEAT